MKGKAADKALLQHIIGSAKEIESYIKDITEDGFRNSSLIHFATIKQLEIIGEASNHISEDLQQSYQHIPWPLNFGLRNFLVHEYFNIDLQIVWKIVTTDLPNFKNQILELYQNEFGNP